ncbi:MAG: CoA transferase [Gammaproteobacteria bacterium]|jgi:crotonobetainyl-CoA:carnitine CoA-transferase CaiB-like acyl-CoA transferase|nr:CoA transferase [Gammaproteobacteria bacterium]NBR17953.1 CoA transferase [Gammaproteobacteria bacterium]NCW57037.1 CoA transferase [Gammaproteobacteria bacterium]NDA43072.1 CoA transferase [Gammaproteobacteria bacterium]NDB25667.1 CoA transferase [Gammaproteobacteria bacterium]
MAASSESASLPLHGIKIVEFTHMVMGPAVGAVLVELGAEVVRIEPIGGDSTRSLLGSGAGYFPMYNRNKRSICLDLKAADGLDLARRLCAAADVVVENFRTGTMDKLGLGYEALAALNPRLIYCSEKGFLSGPYEKRAALDEVTQMMGGLAYMTGPPGRPLRAGTSVIDVTGGMFGAIAVLAALQQRQTSGRGQKVSSALFETTVYLVGQHMAQMAVTGQPAKPMPVRISAWAIYDVFETRDGEHVFVGIVSDGLWQKFCEAFSLAELAADETLKTNSQRVLQREALLPRVRDLFRTYSKAELVPILERTGLPFAPIGKPEDMFEDPHLMASGGLGATTLPDGRETRLPILPIEMDGRRPSQGGKLAKPGEHTDEVLRDLGMTSASIDELRKRRVVA